MPLHCSDCSINEPIRQSTLLELPQNNIENKFKNLLVSIEILILTQHRLIVYDLNVTIITMSYKELLTQAVTLTYSFLFITRSVQNNYLMKFIEYTAQTIHEFNIKILLLSGYVTSIKSDTIYIHLVLAFFLTIPFF